MTKALFFRLAASSAHLTNPTNEVGFSWEVSLSPFPFFPVTLLISGNGLRHAVAGAFRARKSAVAWPRIPHSSSPDPTGASPSFQAIMNDRLGSGRPPLQAVVACVIAWDRRMHRSRMGGDGFGGVVTSPPQKA